MIPFSFGSIGTTINHTAVITGFTETSSLPFFLPMKKKNTPSPDPCIALADTTIFIPAFNLLNMLRLVPASLLL